MYFHQTFAANAMWNEDEMFRCWVTGVKGQGHGGWSEAYRVLSCECESSSNHLVLRCLVVSIVTYSTSLYSASKSAACVLSLRTKKSCV